MNIGIDIIENKRLANKDMTFIKKILTKKELEIYNDKIGKGKIHFLCGRFCAKEAIFKCLNLKSLDFDEVEILNDDLGKPIAYFKDYQFKISISHENNYTVAVALLEK